MKATEHVGSAIPILKKLGKSVAGCLFRPSWKERLPQDYRDILSRAYSPLQCDSKRDLVTLLHAGILIDDGKKWFSLEKEPDNKKCYVIGARELTIEWSNDQRYYKWIPMPESKSSCKIREVAELLQASWLDIAGKIECRELSRRTNYGAYPIIKFTDANSDLDKQPAQISVIVGGNVKPRTAYIRPNKNVQLMNFALNFCTVSKFCQLNPLNPFDNKKYNKAPTIDLMAVWRLSWGRFSLMDLMGWLI